MEAKLVQPWTNHIYTKIQHNLTRLQQTCQNSKTGKKFDTKLCFFGLQRKFCCPGPGGIPSLSFPYKLQNPTVDWDSMEKNHWFSLTVFDCHWGIGYDYFEVFVDILFEKNGSSNHKNPTGAWHVAFHIKLQVTHGMERITSYRE